MTERSSWKIAGDLELLKLVDVWSADSWEWTTDAVTAIASTAGWTPRKTVRGMWLYSTDLSVDSDFVVRFDNKDFAVVRSVAVSATSVVTPHESNTRKAKTFLQESFDHINQLFSSELGNRSSTTDKATQWDTPQGHIVLSLTARSIRLTHYSTAGLQQAEAAAASKAAMVGIPKKVKAPAPWRVQSNR